MDTVLYAQHALERNDFIRKKTNGQNNAGSGMTDREATEINNCRVYTCRERSDRKCCSRCEKDK